MASAGIAKRNVAVHDPRKVVLTLTQAGIVENQALLYRRREALSAILQITADEHKAMLERVAETFLKILPVDATTALTVCRFCDQQRCADCPMDAIGLIEKTV